jgi:hypothetical protein
MDHAPEKRNLRTTLARAGSALVALARQWGPRAAGKAKRVAVRARESRVAGRTRQAARRAGEALKVRGGAVKERVSAWNWPRRALGAIASRYPALGRAWKEFLHSFSLSDRPAGSAPDQAEARSAPPAARRRAPAARTRHSRSNMRKAA